MRRFLGGALGALTIGMTCPAWAATIPFDLPFFSAPSDEDAPTLLSIVGSFTIDETSSVPDPEEGVVAVGTVTAFQADILGDGQVLQTLSLRTEPDIFGTPPVATVGIFDNTTEPRQGNAPFDVIVSFLDVDIDFFDDVFSDLLVITSILPPETFDAMSTLADIDPVTFNSAIRNKFFSIFPEGDEEFPGLSVTISPTQGQIVFGPAVVPLPPSLPLFIAGLGVVSLISRRQRRSEAHLGGG